MAASRWLRNTAAPHVSWCRTSTSGRARSGYGSCVSWRVTSPASGSRSAIITTATRGGSNGMPVTSERAPPPSGSAGAATLRPMARTIAWRLATVADVVSETPRARTLVLDVPGWPGHRAGQHVDVRLTAEDGYQAQRSYSIASAPESDALELTVELVDDGEVSAYLVEDVLPGDAFELRGPIG